MGSKHTTKEKSYYFCSRKQRKDARVIEWTGLEIRRTALLYRGFESHSFRQVAKRESLRFPFLCLYVSRLQILLAIQDILLTHPLLPQH